MYFHHRCSALLIPLEKYLYGRVFKHDYGFRSDEVDYPVGTHSHIRHLIVGCKTSVELSAASANRLNTTHGIPGSMGLCSTGIVTVLYSKMGLQ